MLYKLTPRTAAGLKRLLVKDAAAVSAHPAPSRLTPSSPALSNLYAPPYSVRYSVACSSWIIYLPSGSLVVDGTANQQKILSGGTRSLSASRPLYVFSGNVGSYGYARTLSGQLYYLKMSNGGSLVRDFIPCIRLTDQVAGMYDLVSHSFFKSETAYPFVAGPKV